MLAAGKAVISCPVLCVGVVALPPHPRRDSCSVLGVEQDRLGNGGGNKLTNSASSENCVATGPSSTRAEERERGASPNVTVVLNSADTLAFC